MPTLKAILFLLLVLLPSCNARHYKGTGEDSANGDSLSLDVQEKREEETKSEALDSAELDTESTGDMVVRRILKPSSHKRQDDMPGVWGRSIESQDLAKTNGDDMHAQLMKFDESEEREERRDEGAEPQGLRRRQSNQQGPPGLWGRKLESNFPRPAELWEREIEAQPPGLWGREPQGQPGLWGREPQKRQPGLWERQTRQRAPGLWGREPQNPPGLWGREIRKEPQAGRVHDKW